MGYLNDVDRQYHQLLERVMRQPERGDRTGTGTRSIFGVQMRFEKIDTFFPLITTKRVHMKSVIYELLWMLKGDTNIKYLNDNGVTIWDEWADENGDLGPVYGAQWRNWNTNKDDDGRVLDQIAIAIHSLKTNPNNRRNLVSAWNPAELENMKLPPCHLLFQFYTRQLTDSEQEQWAIDNGDVSIPTHYLDISMYQRSADLLLGIPFNIAQYALMNHLIAKTVNMIPGDLIMNIGDAHIYCNHFEQVKEQLSRESTGLPPRLSIIGEAKEDPADYEYNQVFIPEYNSHAAIKAPVAV